MKHSVFCMVFFLQLCCIVGKAQDTIVKKEPIFKKTAVYAEGGYIFIMGRAGLGAERYLLTWKNMHFNVNVGGGAWQVKESYGPYMHTGIVSFYGNRKHHFEISTGCAFLIDYYEPTDDTEQTNSFHVWPYANVGYRYQKPGSHWLFKINAGYWTGINVGVGYVF